jgi:hypothetical protein
MLSVVFSSCHAECRYAKYRYVECRYTEYLGAMNKLKLTGQNLEVLVYVLKLHS